jgi:phosphoenolpyruvate-protein kinase (PTS system EI component)
MKCLDGIGEETDFEAMAEAVIVVAEELTPSDTIRFDREKIIGIVTVRGGPTSHSAILARAMGVPAVVSAPFDLNDMRGGTLAILNGNSGVFNVGPTLHELEVARKEKEEWEARRRAELRQAEQPAITREGAYRAEVVANIGSVADAEQALRFGAEGVGLFRTEFLYLERNTMPSLAEQVRAYRRVFEMMDGRPVVVRTLDVGGDKEVSYLGMEKEANPFLGWRAIRMIRERPDVLENQFSALLQAAGQVLVEEAILLSDRVYVMTSRPGTIKSDIVIDLPRPRSAETENSLRFVELRHQILDLIRIEAQRSFTLVDK